MKTLSLALCLAVTRADLILNPYTTWGSPPPDRVACTTTADCHDAIRSGACVSTLVDCWVNDANLQPDGLYSCAEFISPGTFGAPTVPPQNRASAKDFGWHDYTAGYFNRYCAGRNRDAGMYERRPCSEAPRTCLTEDACGPWKHCSITPTRTANSDCTRMPVYCKPMPGMNCAEFATCPMLKNPPSPPPPPSSPPPDNTPIVVGVGVGSVVVILLLVVGVVCWCLKKKKDTKPAAPTSPEQVSDPVTGQPLSGTLEPAPVVMAVAPPPDVPVPIAPLAAQPAGVSAGVLQASSPPASLPSSQPPGKFSSDCCACCENGIICCLTCCCPEIGLGQLFQRYSNYDAAGQKTNKCMVIVILVLVCYLGSLIFYSAANGAYLGWSGCYTDKLWSGASWFDAASECGEPDAAYALYTIGFIFFAVWSLVQCFVLMIARQKIRRAHKIPSGYARSTTPACPIL